MSSFRTEDISQDDAYTALVSIGLSPAAAGIIAKNMPAIEFDQYEQQVEGAEKAYWADRDAADAAKAEQMQDDFCDQAE